MVERFLAGRHPNQRTYGVWLSRPGFSVFSTNPDEFLLTPQRKNEQIFQSGVVTGLAAGAVHTINWPEVLTDAPMILFQWGDASSVNNWVPFNPGGSLSSTFNLVCHSTPSGAQFHNAGTVMINRINWAAFIRRKPL